MIVLKYCVTVHVFISAPDCKTVLFLRDQLRGTAYDKRRQRRIFDLQYELWKRNLFPLLSILI